MAAEAEKARKVSRYSYVKLGTRRVSFYEVDPETGRLRYARSWIKREDYEELRERFGNILLEPTPERPDVMRQSRVGIATRLTWFWRFHAPIPLVGTEAFRERCVVNAIKALRREGKQTYWRAIIRETQRISRELGREIPEATIKNTIRNLEQQGIISSRPTTHKETEKDKTRTRIYYVVQRV